MPSGREIRGKIKSIQSTQKITSAMEMVATSKMRKVQDQMRAARPYAEKIDTVVHHMARANLEYRHPAFVERPVRRVGLVVISTDRGLCGGLNTNQFRLILGAMREWDQRGIEVDFVTLGAKGTRFFRRIGGHIIGQLPHLGEVPRVQDLIGAIALLRQAFWDGQIDEIHISYNQFVNTMTQMPRIDRITPVSVIEDPDAELIRGRSWDYLYEPDATEVVDEVLRRYAESLLYRAAVENIASEQAARMVAMRNATDNAGDLIDELQLAYNKARQASITRELSEIVAGAAAV